MKTLIISLLSLFFLTTVDSICQSIGYGYDLSGNRIQRALITLKSAKMDSTDVWKSQDADKIPEDLNSKDIVVYPNPVEGLLQISIGSQDIESSIKIILYDSYGKLLYNQESAGVNYKLNMTDYSSGVYILRIEVDSEIKEWKIIKE